MTEIRELEQAGVTAYAHFYSITEWLARAIAVVSSHAGAALVLTFVVGGLRESGEPARKATTVSLVQPALRARSVGLYYLLRSLAITPAAFAGGLLSRVHPSLPFMIADAIGPLVPRCSRLQY